MSNNDPTTTDHRWMRPLDLEAIEAAHTEAFPGPGVETLGRADVFRHASRELVPALVAEVKRLREALAPFAAIADHLDRADVRDYGDELYAWHLLPGETVRLMRHDCRRAKESLP